MNKSRNLTSLQLRRQQELKAERKKYEVKLTEDSYVESYPDAPNRHTAINIGRWHKKNKQLVALEEMKEKLSAERVNLYQASNTLLLTNDRALYEVASFRVRYSQNKLDFIFEKAVEQDEKYMEEYRKAQHIIYETM